MHFYEFDFARKNALCMRSVAPVIDNSDFFGLQSIIIHYRRVFYHLSRIVFCLLFRQSNKSKLLTKHGAKRKNMKDKRVKRGRRRYPPVMLMTTMIINAYFVQDDALVCRMIPRKKSRLSALTLRVLSCSFFIIFMVMVLLKFSIDCCGGKRRNCQNERERGKRRIWFRDDAGPYHKFTFDMACNLHV